METSEFFSFSSGISPSECENFKDFREFHVEITFIANFEILDFLNGETSQK